MAIYRNQLAFLIYILVNIEVGHLQQVKPVTILCMILEAISIGFFEEIVFRGTMLPLFLEK